MKVVNSRGQLVDSTTFTAADRLLQLSKKKNVWATIAEIIKVWEKSQPVKWKAHLVHIDDVQQTRKNKLASTKDKSLRYLLDIPEPILRMIRILYPVETLPMDKKFLREFARRFPQYAIPEKT